MDKSLRKKLIIFGVIAVVIIAVAVTALLIEQKHNKEIIPIDFDLIKGTWTLSGGYVGGESLDRDLMMLYLGLDEFNVTFLNEGTVFIRKTSPKGVAESNQYAWRSMKSPDDEKEYFIYINNGVGEGMIFNIETKSFMWFSGDNTYMLSRGAHSVAIENEILGIWQLEYALAGAGTFTAEEYLNKISADDLTYEFTTGGNLTMHIFASDGRIVNDKMIWESKGADENFIYSIAIESLGTKSKGTLKYNTSDCRLYSISEQATMVFRKIQ